MNENTQDGNAPPTAAKAHESMRDTPRREELSFEAALAQLEAIVDKLEKGDVPLEESIALYERGEILRAHCDRKLKAAEAKIEQIQLGKDGAAAGVAPFSE